MCTTESVHQLPNALRSVLIPDLFLEQRYQPHSCSPWGFCDQLNDNMPDLSPELGYWPNLGQQCRFGWSFLQRIHGSFLKPLQRHQLYRTNRLHIHQCLHKYARCLHRKCITCSRSQSFQQLYRTYTRYSPATLFSRKCWILGDSNC